MRVLGIEISGTTIRWIIVEGTSTAGSWHYLNDNKISFPSAGSSNGENYKILQQILENTFRSQSLDKVAVIKADQNSGVDRAKVETVIEYACHEAGVTCELIHVNSIINAQKKKFENVVETSPKDSYGNGSDLRPKYLERAFYCAWKCIHG